MYTPGSATKAGSTLPAVVERERPYLIDDDAKLDGGVRTTLVDGAVVDGALGALSEYGPTPAASEGTVCVVRNAVVPTGEIRSEYAVKKGSSHSDETTVFDASTIAHVGT